ncbi:hypothetical protein OUZ56_012040 [Daphnia magna]|uniref:Uncharacterized protein n=1 Tax=Daphnia magna TaxID=35525 RepID=A0ABQ9Z1V3_9CRUS|nr:hypothetical protein OUZ56_012040 [Daphnia magna]
MLSWREAENVRFFDGSAHAAQHKSRRPTPSGVILYNVIRTFTINAASQVKIYLAIT